VQVQCSAHLDIGHWIVGPYSWMTDWSGYLFDAYKRYKSFH